MAKIQDFFIGEPEYINVPPGEYEGPLVIRHSCTVDGHGATLWSKTDAALIIDAPNVTVKNLRVELIGKPTVNEFGFNTDFDAIHISVNGTEAQMDNVEVYGGIAQDDYDLEYIDEEPGIITTIGYYELPRMINLGTFAAGEKNEFLIKLDNRYYANYRVISSICGLKVEPQILSKDNTDLKLTVNPMRDGTILYGDLMLETERPLKLSTKPSKILHRIYISGRAQNGAEIKNLPKIQTALPPLQTVNRKLSQQKATSKLQLEQQQQKTNSFPTPPSISQQVQTNTVRKFFPVSNFPQQQITTHLVTPNLALQKTKTSTEKKITPTSNKVKKGQKVLAPNFEKIRVAFRASNLSNNMTIDACAFCLKKNKKVQRDTDFIFFNNPRHESLGVSLDSKENIPGIGLNLKKLPDEIQSVVIYFSIYDEGNRFENNFSNLSSPEVVVFADEKIFFEFPVQLGREKIFKALEVYRDKDDWKLYFIGLSSEIEFAELCKFYGVEVL